MNTWVVGNIPIGHRTITYPQRIIDSGPHLGEKLFFMKARIMAGQANLKDNVFDLKDFQWLAKEEIKAALSSRDWNDVKNILAER